MASIYLLTIKFHLYIFTFRILLKEQQLIQLLQSLQMASEQQIEIKMSVKQEDSIQQFKCSLCDKNYPKKLDLDEHIKLKHQSQSLAPQEKEKEKEMEKEVGKKGRQQRNRALEIQQNDHEDMIYSYLGELGQKNQQTNIKEDLLLVDQNLKQNIQTNYSFNKVVRTPYEKQLISINVLPKQWIVKCPHSEFINELIVEMTLLYHALEAEKDKWEFRDPMGGQDQAEDEFSLMEIRKLIQNYPKRKLTLKFPHFSIFLLWVSRICKPLAWQEFFIIISSYLAEYYSSELTGKASQRWQKYNIGFQTKKLPSYIAQRLIICNEKTVRKFVQFFTKWTSLFGLVPDFC